MGNPTPQQQSSTSNSTQTTNSSTAPPSYIQPYLGQGIQSLVSQYDNNPAPSYYPGQTVAPQSQNTVAGLNELYQYGASGGTTGQSLSTLSPYLNGSMLDLSKNPYFGGAVSAAVQPVNQQFTNNVLPAISGQFEGAGRTPEAANGAGAATNNALAALTQSESNTAGSMANTAYQQAQQNQLTAAGMLPGIQNAEYQNIGAMGQSGAGTDAFNQANIDSNVARYNYNIQSPWNYINQYLGSLNAGYPGGESSGTSNNSGYSFGYGMPSTNPTSSGIGAGMGIAGLALQAAPMIAGLF
jgi:hypothetical protein